MLKKLFVLLIFIIWNNSVFALRTVQGQFIGFAMTPVIASAVESVDLIWTASDDEVSTLGKDMIVAIRKIHYGINVARRSSSQCGSRACSLSINKNTKSGKDGVLREFIKEYNEFHNTNFNVLVNYHLSFAWIWNSSPFVPIGELRDGRLTGILLEVR